MVLFGRADGFWARRLFPIAEFLIPDFLQNESLFPAIAAALDLPLPRREGLSEAELLEALAAGIGRLLERSPDGLFNALYRLDVAEWVLAQSLASDSPAEELARAVYQRQLQKIRSRAQTPPAGNEDPDLKW